MARKRTESLAVSPKDKPQSASGTSVAEEPAAPEVVEKQAKVAPVPEAKPKVPLRTFCQISGKRPDFMAGFVAYAKSKALETMSIDDWRETLKKYLNTPI